VASTAGKSLILAKMINHAASEGTVAPPDYLREHGAPNTLSDLAHHSVIVSPAHSSPTFSLKDGRITSERVESQLAITTSEGATASAVAGLGIAASGEISVRAELETGQLVRVLPEWDFGSIELNALFVRGLPISSSGSSAHLAAH